MIYISDKEIKVVIKISPKRNLQAQMASIVNYFYSMWKIESIIILHKPFKRKEKLGIILNSFYTASILNTKYDKDITRKGSYTLISHKKDANSKQNTSKMKSKDTKKQNISQSSWVYAKNASLLQHSEINPIMWGKFLNKGIW